MNTYGINGTLYRTGEHLLLKNDGIEHVIKATEYFATCNSDQHHTFVRGKIYEFDDSVHSYSGSSIVLPTTIDISFPSSSILRKVMLYPNSAETPIFVVIDQLRPTPPVCLSDVIVPVYPEAGDMLNIRGEADEIWFAHVLSSDERVKCARCIFMSKILV